MSHLKERKEKNCLNCGAVVQGRYCQNCGQENIEPRETFGHLIFHFIADIFHFDGKFFTTLKYLFTRPGFLSKEYIRGRRQKYLHPVKMFVFTSVVFFLFYHFSPNLKLDGLPENDQLASVEAYDSIQNLLPRDKRDDYLARILNRKNIERRKGGKLGQALYLKNLEEHFQKSAPQILFVSLPILALFFKLIYIRRKHKWYYVDHVIFLIHVFIAVYVILLLRYGLDRLFDYSGLRTFSWLSTGTIFLAFLYPLLSMYHFYGQSFFKTLLKYVIILLFAFFVILTLVVIFAVIALAVV